MYVEVDACAYALKDVLAVLRNGDCHLYMQDLCTLLNVLCTRGPV
jgi:hypothetical protein